MRQPLGPVVTALADALLAGAWTRDALEARARAALGPFGALPAVVDAALAAFSEAPWTRERALRTVIRAALRTPDEPEDEPEDAPARRPSALPFRPRCPRRWTPSPATPPPPTAPLPPLDTVGDVATWLGVDLPGLEWLLLPDRHYTRQERPKADGGVRELWVPRPQLAAAQRRLARGIFALAPVHDAAHGFRLGRSAVTHAAAHAGRAVVLRVDLADFFGTLHAGRVAAVLNALGYRDSVAAVLARLVTHRGRLPQGAPSSPAVANLCAYRLDRRLHGLATATGATYTRYADDLTFSGDAALARRVDRFAVWVAAIATDTGFEVNHRKTRTMRRGSQQRVTGLVVNVRPGVSRRERERLEAILYRCVQLGPSGQNRAGHPAFAEWLRGRVAWVHAASPAQAAPLQALFDAIDWTR